VGGIDNIVLEAGDILYDTITGDVAVLIKRTKSHSYRWSYYTQLNEDGSYGTYAWKMFWVPPDRNTYTEESLVHMIDSGRLVLYKAGQSK